MAFTGTGRPKLVIGVDFDQTIAKTKYPTIIKPKFLAIPVLKWLKRRHTIILWTCRVDKHLDSAVDWCDKQGVSFHHINNNCFDRIKKYGGDCRKLSCDILVDDMAGFVFWPWVVVRVLIKEVKLRESTRRG